MDTSAAGLLITTMDVGAVRAREEKILMAWRKPAQAMRGGAVEKVTF